MYCDLWSQYINVRKLFKGGNYSRAETIWGNTVCNFWHLYLRAVQVQVSLPGKCCFQDLNKQFCMALPLQSTPEEFLYLKWQLDITKVTFKALHKSNSYMYYSSSIVILICQSSDPFFTSLHFKMFWLFGFLWILQDCYIQVGSIWAVFLPCCCLKPSHSSDFRHLSLLTQEISLSCITSIDNY